MSFDPADPIGSVFADVIGKPCWNVRPGYGSAFMMEFGEPHLRVREPIVSNSESEKVRRSLARRQVTIKGDWTLLVEFCGWRVFRDGAAVIDSDTFIDADPSTERVLVDALQGQKLTDVRANGAAGTSRFAFDLGSLVETFASWTGAPFGDWMFFTSGHTLSYRTDGRYSWGPSDATGEHDWLPLPR